MAGAMLMLAAAVAWMLYRRQSADGTLPGSLKIQGATVRVTNVNAVETRKIWQFRGIPGQPEVSLQFDLQWKQVRQYKQLVGNLVIKPGRWVSHRPDRSKIPFPPDVNYNSWPELLLSFDSWWVPRIVTLGEAQQLDVLELPEQYREDVANFIQT